MDDGHPMLDAAAIAHGTILAVGTKDEMMLVAVRRPSSSTSAAERSWPNSQRAQPFINAVWLGTWANVSSPPADAVQTFDLPIATLQVAKTKLGLKPGDWLMDYGYDAR